VIVSAEPNKIVDLYIKKDIVYSVDEAKEITRYFSHPNVTKTIKLEKKNRDKKKCRQDLLSR